ncbi:MAG: phosphoesterase [Verrucomicrobiaceae bacterium]|nr:MAG: phosphoesterase [Verrucomicrobiaceae bacterium]
MILRSTALLLLTMVPWALADDHQKAAAASPPAGPVLASGPAKPAPGVEKMGQVSENRYLLPTNQVLTPAGVQAALPGLRPQAVALSPDGKLLVVAGNSKNLIALDPESGKVTAEITYAPDAAASGEKKSETRLGPAPGSEISFTGLVFSPDGTRIYLSNVVGNIKVFAVDDQHGITAHGTFALPEARTARRKMEIPCGLAVSRDGSRLYVAANVANRLHELDTASGAVLRSWETGVAPFDVGLVGNKAYVSNSGGRRPGPGDSTAPAGAGTVVRVDARRAIANEGSVTVIDLTAGAVKTELLVELHASALAVSPKEDYVVVANTGSDTLSVIDTAQDKVVEKIWARRTPGDLFGAQPGAVAFDPSGERLYVCNGTQNAVAVIKFEPEENESAVTGLIPVGWFPGAVAFDASRRRLCVANIRGIGTARIFKPGETEKLNSKDFFGTVSLVPLPDPGLLESMTAVTLMNMRYPRMLDAALPPRPDQPPRVVPERAGEPSLIKHVVYVIKENRTYDQVLGDIPTGNGDPRLCIFGEKVTPNLHKICREFALLDNTYCCSTQSADGHQWTDSAIANGYMERQVTSGFPRSYPGGKAEDGMDALAWASSGFIWDHAAVHGVSFRNYGEWMLTEAGWTDPKRKDKPKWEDFLTDHQTGAGLTRLASRPAIETLGKWSKRDTVGWDLNVPDIMRAEAFIRELRQFEKDGSLPALTLLFLPNDHTGGTRGLHPTPAAQVADNDLAMGMVVEALSRSRFWKDTCLFAIEDDPQAGWDHVSGYRTTCYVASPYARLRKTVSTPYNHPGLLRTIELMLGLPPMNQMDATAVPMTDCFGSEPDLTPFTAVPNRTPLDQTNPPAAKVADARLRKDAEMSEALNLAEVDRCPEDVLNQILWRAMKGSGAPYPVWAVKPSEDDDD